MVLAPLVTPLLTCLLWGQPQQLLGTTPGQVCTVIYFIKTGYFFDDSRGIVTESGTQPRVLCVVTQRYLGGEN